MKMLRTRFSLSVIFFFVLAICGISAATAFALAGVFEICMMAIVLNPLVKKQEIWTDSYMATLVIQYSDGDELDPMEMLHIGGARVLSALLGFYAIWWYIPATLLFLTTVVDIVTIKKPRK